MQADDCDDEDDERWLQPSHGPISISGDQALREWGDICRHTCGPVETISFAVRGTSVEDFELLDCDVNASESFVVESNTELKHMSGLKLVSSPERIRISDNGQLQDVSALSGVEVVRGDLTLAQIQGDVSQDLRNLTEVEGLFSVSGANFEGVWTFERLQTVDVFAFRWMGELQGIALPSGADVRILDVQNWNALVSLQGLAGVEITELSLSSVGGLTSLVGPDFSEDMTKVTMSGALELVDLAGLEDVATVESVWMSNVGVEDLSGFSGLTEVNQSMVIRNMPNLETLSFPSLASVGEDIEISDVESLSEISLSALVNVGGVLELRRLDGLLEITPFSESLTVGKVEFWDVPLLQSLDLNFELADTNIHLAHMPLLTEVYLASPTQLSSFRIHHTDSLDRIVGLDSLERVSDDLMLEYLPDGVGMDFGLLREVGDLLRISRTEMAAIAGFGALESVGGQLEITHNDSLVNLGGFEALKDVGGLRLDSSSLSQITAFGSLESVRDHFVVRNVAVTTLGNFQSLQTVGGDLSLDGLGSLTSFGTFTQLQDIGGGLYVIGLPLLSGLDELDGLLTIGDTLRITDNSSLPQNVADDFVAGLQSIGGSILVHSNLETVE